MTHSITQSWNEQAWALADYTTHFSIPHHVLLAEAVDVARFAERNWEPNVNPGGKLEHPGLKSAATPGIFDAQTIQELIELVEAVQEAQTRHQLLTSARSSAPMARARFVLSEMRATLHWIVDVDSPSSQREQLDGLDAVHARASSHDAVAAALFDYAELGSRSAERIRGIGGFDIALLDEARSLGARLREQSAGPAVPEPSPGESESLELRNRLMTLLVFRVARVRAAARFVFRRHPELMREVASGYARRRRKAYRRAGTTSGARLPSDGARAEVEREEAERATELG